MPKTLLLADDSVVIQKLVGLSFANEDVDLVTTDNGDDAVAKARECSPDVVLADVVMPGMSGYEVCEAIKKDPQLAGTPVLLLTGTFEAFDEARAEAAGSDGHITKPFEAQALVDRVNELLARGRQAAPAPAAAAGDADFFDASAVGRDVTRSASPATPEPAVATPPAAPPPPPAATDAFSFGSDAGGAGDAAAGLPPLDDSDLLDAGAGGDFGGAANGSTDHTVAYMPDGGAPVIPLPDSPTRTAMAPENDPLATPPAESAAASEPWSDRRDDPLSLTPPGADPFAGSAEARPADPAHTTIIMSEGDSGSDAVHLASDDSDVRSLDDELGPRTAAPLGTPQDGGPQPAAARAPAPDQTLLADDLFASDPGAQGRPDTPDISETSDVFDFGSTDPLAESSGDLMSAASDPFATPVPAAPADPAFGSSRPEAPRAAGSAPPPLAEGYDVSVSDLGDSFTADVTAPPANDRLLESAPAFGSPLAPPPEPEPFSADDDLLGGEDVAPAFETPGTETPALEVPAYEAPSLDEVPAPAASARPPAPVQLDGPDISPVMRQRIHETLERVAWEAFSDLSETVVKQVLERVESIAWEVIPQMTEALIKEEIRRMKGEGED